mmetsp:Transcript_27490/g.88807  ORF Transcript_27490/g.88807 Transcript_27490/m.88807 type:complete len:224 (-) Transcript_27490:266-937(-)|eukprot:CAMPEP_0118903368 /NCGR_PEP_ID=MMETSP1166-20130328/8261_1 /TAXON_ID=1104430 /ORGANISM="Chrysoreinhardia sp, Strain CCMP3193" /LENGTH=223 /DNA_ID=CAMNT_0006842595 /DNA_START=157 /DNA_END=828 /DNA_ORIENTATION=+
MILLTYIARVSDGMLLVASMETMRSSATGESSETLDVYKAQARELLREPQQAAKCSIDSGPFQFHSMVSGGVVYLALTRKGYPKQLVFRYLDEVCQAFIDDLGRDWQSAVELAARPYAFIKFDKTLQRKRKEFADPDARANQAKIDEDIADITSIMKRNIDEVLNRGEKLDRLVETSSNLKDEAHKYKWGAKKYNAMVLWQQYAPLVAGAFVVAFVLYLKLRW